jgi:hypothetical protein
LIHTNDPDEDSKHEADLPKIEDISDISIDSPSVADSKYEESHPSESADLIVEEPQPEPLPEQQQESIAEQLRKLVEDLIYKAVDPDHVDEPSEPSKEKNNLQTSESQSQASVKVEVPECASDVEFEAAQTAFSLAYTDCFLIFRALCKLSTKELPPT